MSAPQIALCPVAAALYDRLNAAVDEGQIDNIVRAVAAAWGLGNVDDDEAQFLHVAADGRRPFGRRTPGTGHAKPIPAGRLAGRLGSIFPRRRPQRSPDRAASRQRQRVLGGSGALPPQLRQHFTQGERAVLFVISSEVKRHGVCDWPIDKIAAMAGVCRSTAQNAMREAQRLAHIVVEQRPVPGRKNLPNVISVVSREWRAWLERGPIGFKTFDPTKIIDRKLEGIARFKDKNGVWRKDVDRLKPMLTAARAGRAAPQQQQSCRIG